MSIIRFIVGKVLLVLNFITLPQKGSRSQENLLELEAELGKYSLYQFEACPFCIKVRRAMRRLNLPIELKNAKAEPFRTELLKGGGKLKAPCLRIEEDGELRWMYESSDIIDFLRKKFPL